MSATGGGSTGCSDRVSSLGGGRLHTTKVNTITTRHLGELSCASLLPLPSPFPFLGVFDDLPVWQHTEVDAHHAMPYPVLIDRHHTRHDCITTTICRYRRNSKGYVSGVAK